MIEHHLDLPTADGAMSTFVVHPEEGGPFPVVLFYMDAPGKREELHDMARRLASVGYCVVLPNLYHRNAAAYHLRDRSEAAMAEMYALMGTLNAATAECDTRAMLAFVDGLAVADRSRIGAVGYCMSGPFVVWAALAFPDRLRVIASIYGANLVTDRADSPHRLVAKLACESYFVCAEIDRWASPAQIEALQAGLQDSHAPHRVEWYPGAQHGFAFPLRAGIYHQPSAERHWERLFRLFERTLRKAA
ncbi:dienelactone hydrolase family protein [soil metagenome]